MSTVVAVRDKVQTVVTTIQSDDFKQKLAQALPENVSVERFVRTAATAIQVSPEILDGQGAKLIPSLYNAVIRCAQDGLMPDGREAALVKYRVKSEDTVRYMPMIGGFRKKGAEHGFSITSQCVHEADEFTYTLGLSESLTHVPPRLGTDRGPIIGAYAVARHSEHGVFVEVMSTQEIEAVRAVSRAATSEYGPWVKWWPEMARKTVARRLFKQLPLGADPRVASMLRSDDSGFQFKPADLIGEVSVPDTAPPDDDVEAVVGEIVEPDADGSFTSLLGDDGMPRRRGRRENEA